jgi:cytochrome c oxidase cbb3-type subunit 1
MSPLVSDLPVTAASAQNSAAPAQNSAQQTSPSSSLPVALAAWHSLTWLVVANGVGVLLATMLLVPTLNSVFGEWTYGRWMSVHMNLQLYGWCSLPLVAFLFSAYRADRPSTAAWCRPALWLWSVGLAIGSISWLTGHSSGKLFLDWVGFPRVFYPLALIGLWLVLLMAFLRERNSVPRQSTATHILKIAGLILLPLVPVALYIASNPAFYPPINPDSGGPTGASQLESVLLIIAILLLLPYGLTRPKQSHRRTKILAWAIFAAEALLCLGLGRADISHHRPVQYISLGSLLVWLPLTPAYFNAFHWHPATRRWRIAFLAWWSVLIPTGWCLFLPGVLDHFKFTDGLVGHSLLAMAGFTSSLLIFVLVQLMGTDAWMFNRTWSFYLWQGSVLAYVLIMFTAGWFEGSDPAFTIVPGLLRNSIYALRLFLGLLLLASSAEWLLAANALLREPKFQQSQKATQ